MNPILPLLASMALTTVPLSGSEFFGRAPHSANPVLPGYYADPSIVQHDGKHFIYATLDPWGGETLGCWESSDFKNWTYRKLNWPTKRACTSPESRASAVWAPSVVRGKDGKFYMYVSVGSEIWAGSVDHPLGPWHNALGEKQLISWGFKPGYHMIDSEAFIDDDGQAWLYWGSGHGWVNGKCWLVRLKPDMVTFDGEVLDVTPSNFFEAPLMVKRHGKYFLMYSAGKTIADTYQIHYAVADALTGPFVEPDNSPILVTDKPLNFLSPGHHTVFQQEGRDYILYHRHSIPFDAKFIGRQICVDPIVFTAAGRIEKITPTHAGPALVQGRAESQAKLSANASITSSSDAGEFTKAAFAIDDNYATRWAPASDAKGARLELDLGSVQQIRRQLIRPEYAWKPCRFVIAASTDGQSWETIQDHTREAVVGSPITSNKPVTARYLRLVFPEEVKGSAIGIIEWAVF